MYSFVGKDSRDLVPYKLKSLLILGSRVQWAVSLNDCQPFLYEHACRDSCQLIRTSHWTPIARTRRDLND